MVYVVCGVVFMVCGNSVCVVYVVCVCLCGACGMCVYVCMYVVCGVCVVLRDNVTNNYHCAVRFKFLYLSGCLRKARFRC